MMRGVCLLITIVVGVPAFGMKKIKTDAFKKIGYRFNKTTSLSMKELLRVGRTKDIAFRKENSSDLKAVSTIFFGENISSLWDSFKQWLPFSSNKLEKNNKKLFSMMESDHEYSIIPEPIPEGIYAAPVPDSFSSLNAAFSKPKQLFSRASNFAHLAFNVAGKKGIKGLPYQTRSFSSNPSPGFDIALNGEAARLLNPERFYMLLKNNGYTIADSVKADCQQVTQEIHTQIRTKANLSDKEWKLCQSIMSLKNELKKNSPYSETNIIIKDALHPYIVTMIKDTMKKAQIPFKVIVSLDRNAHSIADVMAHHGPKGFRFTVDNDTGEATLIEADITMHLRLHADYWGTLFYPSCKSCFEKRDEACLYAQAIIAHEVTHLSHLHGLERGNFMTFLGSIKGLKGSVLEQCIQLKEASEEYQADVLPLMDPLFALAQLHYFSAVKNEPQSSIHISKKKGHELAFRAVALHRLSGAY